MSWYCRCLRFARLSGVTDVDAATLSFAKAAPIDLTATVAATAISLLVLSNMFLKMALAIIVGGCQSGPMLMLPLFARLIVGAIVMLATI